MINHFILLLFLSLFTTDVYAGNDNIFIPILKDTPAQFDGILMNEETAKKVAKEKIEYKSLKAQFEVTQSICKEKEKLYQTTIKKADDELNKINTWWTRNKLELGVMSGFVVGVSASILIFYAVR